MPSRFADQHAHRDEDRTAEADDDRGHGHPSQRARRFTNPFPAARVKATMSDRAKTAARERRKVYRLRIAGQPLSIDEERLVALARAGDRRAFEEIVHLHGRRLHAVVARLCGDPQDVEEVLQETMLRAWRGIGRFDGRSAPYTWLYRIAVNESLRRGRQRRRRALLRHRPCDEVPDWREAPGVRAEEHDFRAALEAAVRALPIDLRAALVLRDIEGLSTREAAEIVGIGEAAFKSRLHRARVSVRDAVAALRPEERGP
jgi:RNA polymerase sigma factor (sigma-70 family)